MAKVAKKHHKPLDGLNHYANKIANIRAEANNLYKLLGSVPVEDGHEAAELVRMTFSNDALMKDRVAAARELKFALKTNGTDGQVDYNRLEDSGVFPLSTLSQTKRGYMVAIGYQMNGCYTSEWWDACAVMMRRLLEAVIIEAFEAKKIDAKVKDNNGDFLQLTGLINSALAETSWNLPRNVKRDLPNLRDLGHKSAHGRHHLAKKMYVDELKTSYRDAVEAFLHIASLL
ncbi:MAG: hypothetical protein JWN24_3102 [Phycisphaerales bacterium]|nr:hypothetical protein [Phycisphaerales bacterium]